MNNIQQLTLDLGFRTDYSSERYHVGPSNEKAHTWLMRWPSGHFQDSFAWVVGPKGSGKTHLASIWASQHQAFWVNFEMTQKMRPRDLIECNQHFVLDNIERFFEEVWLFDFYNLVKEENKFLLVTSSCVPKQCHFTLQDLKSRLMTFHVFSIDLPDDATCCALLKKVLADKGLVLKDRVLYHIIHRIERSYYALNYWAKVFETWHRQFKRLSLADINRLVE